MTAPSGAAPIFVVGVARSGTTLLRSVLERSGQVAIANESHFAGHPVPHKSPRRHFRRVGDLADDRNVGRLVELIYSGGLRRRTGPNPYFAWLVKHVDRGVFEERLLGSDRSERAVFEVMLRLYAEHRGRPIIGEKTPAHIRHVDTLLEWFPGARVIHMIRDPRAVYVSELRRRRQQAATVPYRVLTAVPPVYASYVLLKTTAFWAEAADRHVEYSRRYAGHYWPLRFEDLVRDPDQQVERLFRFLGLELNERVLDPKVVSQGFSAGEQGFDAAAATRWRKHISPAAARWLSAVLASRIQRLGYEA